MNERIREIASRIGPSYTSTPMHLDTPEKVERFALMIIEEYNLGILDTLKRIEEQNDMIIGLLDKSYLPRKTPFTQDHPWQAKK
jgi:hypothetical protein